MAKFQRVFGIHSKIKELSRTSGKSSIWLLRDFLNFRSTGLVSLLEYEHYKLYRKDKEFRETFLSYAKAERYWEVLNPRKYACLARDKFIGHCLLETLGIPTSNIIAYYNPECAYATGTTVYQYNQLARLLRDSGKKSFVIKPSTDSAHGEGVTICRELIEENEQLVICKTDGTHVPLQNFLGNTPLLFETLIPQTGQFSDFNSSSLNTVRIMTALYPDNSVKVFAGFIKIGRKGSDIDNAGNGGNIDCGVNVDNGQLYNAIQFNSWKDICKIDMHPDSQKHLEGIYIENWDLIKEQLKHFQGLIPQLKTIGWDVAITENGPVIVEINNWWDTTGQEFIGRGWGPEVKDCYDAWVKFYSKK